MQLPGTQWDVKRFDTIDSTNRYLMDEARSGARDRLVAAASHQTAGRGRRGRVWDSKPGASLLVSVLFWPPDDIPMVRYSQAIGLAVVDACDISGGFRPALKWPNDVVIDGRKLAGVLGESETVNARTALVVGCGINLNWGGAMPEALRDFAVSADELAGHAIDPDQFLSVMLTALQERLSRMSWIADSYRQRCVTLGSEVKVQTDTGDITGKAVDVDDNGTLIVEDESSQKHHIMTGNVVHLRPL